MGLTDSNNMIMPVAPTGFGGGLGGGWGDGIWLILLVLFAIGGNGFGFGGFGGGVGGLAADGAMLYPWMNQSQQVNDGFRDQMLNSSIGQIQNSVNGLSNQLCNSFAGVEANANARQIANMQQAFDSQTAMTAGMNNIAMGLQNCCCENRASIADLKYTVATENCADRTAAAENTQAILSALNSGVQSIKDQLCSDKIEQKNDTIAQLRSELLYARGQASQDVQTAVIQAGQRNLANEVEQYIAPRAIPAYIVQNPACCGQTYACGM